METKLHISLVSLKAPMLKIPIVIVKKKITSNVGPIIFVSFVDKRKTQIRWAVVVTQKLQR